MIVDADKAREKLAKVCDELAADGMAKAKRSGTSNREHMLEIAQIERLALLAGSSEIRQADLSDCAVDLEAQLHEAQQAYVSADRRAESQAAEIERLKEDAKRLDRLESRADDWTYKNQKAWSFRCAAHLSLREALDAIDSSKDKS